MEEITEQKGSAGEHTPRSGGIKAHKLQRKDMKQRTEIVQR